MTDSKDSKSGKRLSWLRRERWQIYFVATSLIALGLLCIGISPEIQHNSERWAKGIGEFGIALVIAGILMGGVERYLKESLFSQIESKFSKTLDSFATTAFDLQQFARLPVPLRERLRARVLSAPVIQRSVSYTYDLSLVEKCDAKPTAESLDESSSTQTDEEDGQNTESPENQEPCENGDDASPSVCNDEDGPDETDDRKLYRALVTACSTYVNLTTASQQFIVKESLPKSSDRGRDDYGFRRITGRLTGDGDFPQELVPQAIQSYISHKAGSMFFERGATLEPSAKLSVRFESIAYLDEDETISLEAFLPTVDMDCTTSGSGLDFSGQAGDALSDIWNVTLCGNDRIRWELNGAILPGQGFDIWFEESRASVECDNDLTLENDDDGDERTENQMCS